MRALEDKYVPGYLCMMVASYFTDRLLKYDTKNGPRKYQITGGVPQGSVLGPRLWNVMYDGLLRLVLPRRSALPLLLAAWPSLVWCSLGQSLDPVADLLESLLPRLLPQLPSCLVVVQSRSPSYLDLVPSGQLMRTEVGSPQLTSVLRASYRMKCTGYLADEDSAWEMLSALGEARSEAVERHLPRVLVLPAPGRHQGEVCRPFAHHEAAYIPDMLLVTTPSDISSTAENETLVLLTNNFSSRTENASENCLLLGEWPSNIHDFYPDKTSDLQGKELVVATLDFPPYTLLSPRFDGMEARFALEFCRRYNCTVSAVWDDDLWGEIFDNRTGNGISGAVYMDRADLGMGAVYAWEREHLFLDYSQSYQTTRVTVLVPRPASLPEWRIPLLPFSATMWALQLVSVLAAAAVMSFVNKAVSSSDIHGEIGGEFSSLGGITLRAFAMALLQPPPSRLPPHSPLRRFFTIFEVLFLFFTTIYSGALSAVLTVPLYYPPIDTPLALYEAGIPWAADHEAWTYSLQGATEPHLKGLVARFHSYDTKKLISLSKQGGYGFSIEIMAAGHVPQTKHLSGEMILGLHVMKTELYTSALVFLLRKGSPYTQRMNDLLGRCMDGGLMLLWETDVTLNYLSSRLQTALKISEGTRVEVHKPTQLRVVHVQGAFILLGLGLALATLAFGLEACRLFSGHGIRTF